MRVIFNCVKNLSRRQALRNEMTPAEVLLWSQLKGKQTGYKFRRQHGIGEYIVDFYCPDLRLVIELDGNVHGTPEAEAYDQRRSEYLASVGLQVIRFANTDVFNNLEGVLEAIRNACKK
ncbi:endonuclease domain-containing protein [Candidatus Uhrbacteria bacterium]|nr:endonuclease domain-containing protein [Candidatus Uhrbacteria bacterium]